MTFRLFNDCVSRTSTHTGYKDDMEKEAYSLTKEFIMQTSSLAREPPSPPKFPFPSLLACWYLATWPGAQHVPLSSRRHPDTGRPEPEAWCGAAQRLVAAFPGSSCTVQMCTLALPGLWASTGQAVAPLDSFAPHACTSFEPVWRIY